MEGRVRYRKIRFVLWAVLALNISVAIAKIAWGVVSNSAAMEADGFHSLFDGTSNVLGLVGLWLASAPPDEQHPYGHGKFESFAAALIGFMLALAGYAVGRSAIDSLVGKGDPTEVTAASFIIMGGTLAINGFVTLWERRAGRRLGSEVLLADASHTLSDVLVSLGVIVSLVLVSAGVERADGVVALLVALAILRTAWKVIRGVMLTLGDAARLPVPEVVAHACAVSGVIDCHAVRTRGPESHVYVDLHVLVDPDTTVLRGHAIAHDVESELRRAYPQVADVVVHVEPDR
jgi:cation diffusion facilitator family transporter